MTPIYFDNAASTPLLPEVMDEMHQIEKDFFANPSSTHYAGRKAKNVIENARRNIANLLGAEPKEIYFTSGATAANHIILTHAVQELGVKTIISSKIEHKAVLEPIKKLEEKELINVHYVQHEANGNIDYVHLENLLKECSTKTLISLMGANNETGNLLDLKKVAELASDYNAYFHSDTVQLIGHIDLKFNEIGIDFATCSAHKFHGPKGIGFIYANKKNTFNPVLFGGGQERGIVPGTQNIVSIKGTEVALESALKNLHDDASKIQELKNYFISSLRDKFSNDVCIHGDEKTGLFTILNVGFNKALFKDMLLFSLDLKNIAASEGSACSSGSNQGSHVIDYLYGKQHPFMPIRFSFSKFNTKEEVDYCIEQLTLLKK